MNITTKTILAFIIGTIVTIVGLFSFAETASAQANPCAGGSRNETSVCIYPAYSTERQCVDTPEYDANGMPTGNTVQSCQDNVLQPYYYASLADCQASGRDVSRCSAGSGAMSQVRQAVRSGWERASKSVSDAADFISNPVDNILGRAIKWIAWLVFYIAGWMLTMSSNILDLAIEKSISSGILNNLTVIDVGWRVIRDFCNMFFIFILIYVSITTILDIGGPSAKKTLANVIVSALLINFSLFFGKVIIDAGNIVAVQFWNRMMVQKGGVSVPSAGNWLMDGAKIQTVLDPQSDMNAAGATNLKQYQFALIYLMGAIVMFIMAYAFLFGAFLMAYRLVKLMILLIVSPWAFLGLALPKGSYFDKWLDDIVSQSTAAPIFLILLYLVITIIRSSDLMVLTSAQGASFAAAASGNSPDSFVIFFNLLIIIILLLTVIEMTVSSSGKAGSFASKWAKSTMGFAGAGAIAGTAFAGRTIGRRAGQRLSESQRLQDLANGKTTVGNKFARTLITKGSQLAVRGGQAAQQGSWDARRTGVGKYAAGALAGATGINLSTGPGFMKEASTLTEEGAAKAKAEREAREKLKKEAEAAHPSDASKQKAYIEASLAGQTGTKKTADGVEPVLDAKGNPVFDKDGKQVFKPKYKEESVPITETGDWKKELKDLKEKISKEEEKKNLDMLMYLFGENPSIPDDLKADMEAFKARAPEILRKTSSTTIADMSKEHLTNKELMQHLDASDLRAIGAKTDIDDAVITANFEHVMSQAEQAIAEGRDPRTEVKNYAFIAGVGADSKWNVDPSRRAKVASEIRNMDDENKKARADKSPEELRQERRSKWPKNQ